jgi:hypothetical protein
MIPSAQPLFGFRSLEIRLSASLWSCTPVLQFGVHWLHLLSPEAPGVPLPTEIDIKPAAFIPLRVVSFAHRVAERALCSGPRPEVDRLVDPSQGVDF